MRYPDDSPAEPDADAEVDVPTIPSPREEEELEPTIVRGLE
ncbi:hypothetical protein [Actinokineospora xionganensis]|nr:hypothetical protein [Actinokineospora xionganensis]